MLILGFSALFTASTFTYLKSKPTNDEKREKNVEHNRIAQEKLVFNRETNNIVTANTIISNAGKSLTKGFEWRVALRGAKTWTMYMKRIRGKFKFFKT